MAGVGVLKLVFLVVAGTMVMVMVAPTIKASIPCNQVIRHLTPCEHYLWDGAALPQGCCNGVQAVVNSSRTSSDYEDICKCLKQTTVGHSYNSSTIAHAEGLAGKCGVQLQYKIDPFTDCKVKS